MKRFSFLFFFLYFIATSNAQQENELKVLTANLNAMTLQQKVDTRNLVNEFIALSDSGRYNDVMVLQLYLDVNIPDNNVEKFIDTQLPNGGWGDINYKDNKRSGWAPTNHATRIQSLVKVYFTPSSVYYQSKELSVTIHNAMKFWFDSNLVCRNWWYNEIGIPKILGPAFVLMKNEMSAEEMKGALAVMDRAKFKMTGQNKVWLAGNIFLKSLLEDDLALATQARDTIVSEIYISSNEGLQSDFSFHQHGPQMQFGNYGLSYISSMAYWARVFAGTAMAVSGEKLNCLRDYFTNGLRWTVWKGYFDVNACGRQVFKDSQKGKAHGLAVAAINMGKVDPAKTKIYNSYVYQNQSNLNAQNTIVGNQYYWQSDYAIQRTKNWFASVRMSSIRTIGVEMTNDENRQGYYSADGVTMVLVKGDEYNNIYPYWDWKHLPGLTAYDDGKPNKRITSKNSQSRNQSDFVGGVSDGYKGATTMVLNRDGLHAHKSVFFFDNAVVSLGAGITTDNSLPLFTTVDQCHAKGEIKVNKGKHLRWIHQGDKGYYFYSPTSNIEFGSKIQTGAWDSIAPFYKNMPDSGHIFKLLIKHERNVKGAKYAYATFPCATLSSMDQFAHKPTINVLRNDENCQAVANKDHSLIYVIFYKPNVLDLGNGKKIESKDAAIFMIEKIGNKTKISVADPTHKLNCITLDLPQRVVFELSTKEGYRGRTKTMTIK